MQIARFLAVFLLLTSTIFAQIARPVPAVSHVLIVSIDGARPDLLMRAQMPNVRKLMQRASFSLWARTIPEAITLPSHTSMVTGVSIAAHGIDWNNDQPADKRIAVKVPTLFQLAKQANLSTMLVAGKSKFITLSENGVDWAAVPDAGKKFADAEVAQRAAAIITEHKPDVMFVHFPDNDSAGHGHGWGSPTEIKALEAADVALGVVLDALDQAKLTDSTLVILSADHGGTGKNHGKNDVRSRHIPWIAAAPGVKADYDLTQITGLEIDTQDTFATACWVLGIELPEHCEGKPIEQIFTEPATRPARTE